LPSLSSGVYKPIATTEPVVSDTISTNE